MTAGHDRTVAFILRTVGNHWRILSKEICSSLSFNITLAAGRRMDLGDRVGIGRPLRKEASVDTQWSGQETVLDLGSHQAEVSG